jgi:cytochrome P450
MDETPEPNLDLKARPNVQNPFPLYRWLREHDPVHWSASLNGWVITRFADVLAVFEEPLRFSSDRFRKIDAKYASERPAVKAVADVLAQWLVFRDPPDHDRLRARLQPFFTPRELERSRERIQATVDRLLDLVVDHGEAEFISAVAFPLPAMVIAMLLGAPTEDIESIKGWSDRLASYLGGSVDERDNFAEAYAGLSGLVDYFRALLRERELSPRDDLMSRMLQADDGEALGRDEVVANCVLLLFAGHETTTNLLGNGLLHLLGHPDQAAALYADPRLTPGAVEELLRYDGPVPATIKIATEDIEWHGRSIRRGDMVLPFMSAANRDPRQFADPEVLDVRRAIDRHLAFAYGLHFCLGAWLARLEARLTFDTLLARLPALALASREPPSWKPMIFLRGLESLRLTWQPPVRSHRRAP